MYFGGDATFVSFATGTIAVVAVAMIGSITILPALLSLCGDRVDKGRVPGLGRLKARMTRRSGCGRVSSIASCAARSCPRWPRSRCCWRSPRRR
jgi:RND superfamily putative drug exporter